MSRFYAIGVGPGDPELLTRKAERVLRNADVVLAPVSSPTEASVALETIKEFLDDNRQEIIIHQFPMTSDKSVLVPAWQEAAAMIADRIASGKDVAFITIGDPLLYSTFIYLLHIFRDTYPNVEIEIVPGISSINTAAAAAGIPLAESEEQIAIVPATGGIETIRQALTLNDTIVLLKVKPVYTQIIGLLKEMGLADGAVFVERVGSTRQKVLKGAVEMEGHQPDYLSLMIIRK